MQAKRSGRVTPLPLFGVQNRRHQGGSSVDWCLSVGLRLLLGASLVLFVCGLVGLAPWGGVWGTGSSGTGQDEDDRGLNEIGFVRSVQGARAQGQAPQRTEEQPKPEAAKDWLSKWAAKRDEQPSKAEDDVEPSKRPGERADDDELPRSPCPYFASITATTMTVRWQHPNASTASSSGAGPIKLWCELKSTATHRGAQTRVVYQGQDTQAELESLLPVTEYKLSLLCRRDKEGPSRDGHETMRACARQVVTRGARNLLANPSFEDRGPQQYVKYFDSNYMQIEPNSFPAHWHSMMTPIELCRDRKMTGAKSLCFTSPDKANYKYGASQFVFINATSDNSQEAAATHHARIGGGSDGGKRYLLLSGWSAASNVTGKQDGGYSIGLQIKFADGSYSYGHKMTWSTGDHRWEKECLVIETYQDVISVNLFVLFVDHAGTVWFDELYLAFTTSIEPDFEGCKVEQTSSPVLHGCCPVRHTIRSAVTPDPMGVTIATQLTIDRLPALRMMAQNWDGPISAALFVMSEDEADEVLYFRSTWSKLADNVDFHLVKSERNYAYKTLGLYPVNTLRNVAMIRSRTEHVITLDVDFIPSPDSHGIIMDMMPELRVISQDARDSEPDSPGIAWVIPAFEIEPGVPLPDSRRELVEMSRRDLIRQVHEIKWAPAHGPTNYPQWMRSSEPYEIWFKPEYEPYTMVNRDTAPLFDERFIGYGYDKVAQATELNTAGYRFFGLPDVFAIHYDHGVPKWRSKGDVMRSRVFQNFYAFLGEVDVDYKTWPPRRYNRQPEIGVDEYDAEKDADTIKAAFKPATYALSSLS